MTPRYFLWRQTDREPWRVHNVRRWYPAGGEYAVWRGDDYRSALKECKKLNTERKEGKNLMKLAVAISETQRVLTSQGCVFRGQEWLGNHELSPHEPCYCGRPGRSTLAKDRKEAR